MGNAAPGQYCGDNIVIVPKIVLALIDCVLVKMLENLANLSPNQPDQLTYLSE
jgi:hypothetical protein